MWSDFFGAVSWDFGILSIEIVNFVCYPLIFFHIFHIFLYFLRIFSYFSYFFIFFIFFIFFHIFNIFSYFLYFFIKSTGVYGYFFELTTPRFECSYFDRFLYTSTRRGLMAHVKEECQLIVWLLSLYTAAIQLPLSFPVQCKRGLYDLSYGIASTAQTRTVQ
jgi:hypothetical protein